MKNYKCPFFNWISGLNLTQIFWFPVSPPGLNSILFAINIDNSDLNGGALRGGGSSVSSLLKESTQGVSSLLREISTATAVVPGFTPKTGAASDPLPVLPRSASAGRKPRCVLEVTGRSGSSRSVPQLGQETMLMFTNLASTYWKQHV